MAAPSNPPPKIIKILLPESEFCCDDVGALAGAVKFVINGFAAGAAGAFVAAAPAASGDELAGGWFVIVGEFVGAAFGSGGLDSFFVPMMMSGWATMTGAGGGALVGFGAGGGGGAGNAGNWGRATGNGGKLTEQPVYWPSCDRNTTTNGWCALFCSLSFCPKI